jgi:hypothetical protein
LEQGIISTIQIIITQSREFSPIYPCRMVDGYIGAGGAKFRLNVYTSQHMTATQESGRCLRLPTCAFPYNRIEQTVAIVMGCILLRGIINSLAKVIPAL